MENTIILNLEWSWKQKIKINEIMMSIIDLRDLRRAWISFGYFLSLINLSSCIQRARRHDFHWESDREKLWTVEEDSWHGVAVLRGFLRKFLEKYLQSNRIVIEIKEYWITNENIINLRQNFV